MDLKKIKYTGLTVKDIQSTEPSRLCNYILVLNFYISPNNNIFIARNISHIYEHISISLNIIIVTSNFSFKQSRRKYDIYKHKMAKC